MSLVIKTATDQVVLHAHTLVAAMNSAIVRTVSLPGTSHNNIWDSQASFTALDTSLGGC